MIKKYLHIVLFFTVAVLFAACDADVPEKTIPSLDETFSKADKRPFGGYIAYRTIDNMFNRSTIRDKRGSFDKTWQNISDTAALYVCIAPVLFVNETEAKAMMDYVYAGNSLFIAANYIDSTLLKEIKCREYYRAEWYYYNEAASMTDTYTKFNDSAFSYFYQPFKNSFKYEDKDFTKVLGVNEDGMPNYIVYFFGKGKLFLHCDARAFSNYFLLKNNNFHYLEDALSYTGDYPSHVYWDDHYRKLHGRSTTEENSGKEFDSFAELMKHWQLAWAFWLSLILLLLYILFGGKRRQRIIKILKSNENTSVTFTETIGRLYLQKRDNKNIAEKMITYFNEHVRNNYFLSSTVINDDFITTLSRKSGVQKDKVETLYRTISHAQNNMTVDDYQLLSLNEQIQNFYKKK